MTLEGIIYSRKQFEEIGFEKTEQKKDDYILYKKMGKIFLVKEMDSVDKKDKVYYVKKLNGGKND